MADLDVIKAFYSALLTDPGTTSKETVLSVVSEGYVGVPTPPAGPGSEGLFNSLRYFGEVVPDLRWEALDIIDHQDGRFTIRGRATGTPVGPFLGVESPTGKSFDIMSIDILTVENGRIVHSYHLEDWTGAIAQLTA